MFLCRCYLKQEFTDCLAMHLAYIKSFMQNCSMLHFLELFAVINFVQINAVNYRLISRPGVVFFTPRTQSANQVTTDWRIKLF